MELITAELRAQLLANGKQLQSDPDFDPDPVVRLVTPDGACVWLLSDIHPDDEDIAFGLFDLGMGFPEMGSVSLSEVRGLLAKFGIFVERDPHWTARGPLSAYAAAAHRASEIVELPGGSG